MKTRHATSSTTTSSLSLVFAMFVINPVLAQDSNNAATEQTPASTLGDAIDSPDTRSRDDDCVNLDGTATDNTENSGADSGTARLETDARIDPDRLDCLDANRDAPHEDNLRGENPPATSPSDSPGNGIDDELRNEGSEN